MLQVIDYNNSNLENLAFLYNKIVSAPPWNEKWKGADIIGHLLEIINTPNFVGLIAVENGKPVGMLMGNIKTWWTGNSFYVEELLVDIDKQRIGVGTKLLLRIEETLLSKNVSSIYLHTRKDFPAFKFYEKLGFKLDPPMCMLSKEIKRII